jgi:hypothetical protein
MPPAGPCIPGCTPCSPVFPSGDTLSNFPFLLGPIVNPLLGSLIRALTPAWLPRPSEGPPDLGKMSKEKSRSKMSKEKSHSCLNLRRLHTWRSVPYLFVELQLRVVVIGLPRLSPPSSWTWQDAAREVAQLLEPTDTPHVAVGPVLVR